MPSLPKHSLAIALAGLALVAPGQSPAQQMSSPYAYCYAVRNFDNPAQRTYYLSRVWSVGRDAKALDFNLPFQTFVTGTYGKQGGWAQCQIYDGQQEAERQMNNVAVDARAQGAQAVFTDWWPR